MPRGLLPRSSSRQQHLRCVASVFQVDRPCDAGCADAIEQVEHLGPLAGILHRDGDPCAVFENDKVIEGVLTNDAVGVGVVDLRILRLEFSKTGQRLKYGADAVLEFALMVDTVAVKERVTTCGFRLLVGGHAQGEAEVRLVPIIFARRGAGRISGRPVFPSPRPKSSRGSPRAGSWMQTKGNQVPRVYGKGIGRLYGSDAFRSPASYPAMISLAKVSGRKSPGSERSKTYGACYRHHASPLLLTP